jgi:hypothetical protein
VLRLDAVYGIYAGLYAAAVRNGLIADDGLRQCWATIRSG